MNEHSQPRPEQERLVRKLESIADFTEKEREAVLGLPLYIRLFAADRDIVREGDTGWCAATRGWRTGGGRSWASSSPATSPTCRA